MVTLTEKSHCKVCLKPLDAHLSTKPNETPEPGSVSICNYCGKISVFDKEMNLRPITDEEIKNVEKYHPVQWRMIKAIEKGIMIRNKLN